MHGLNPYVVQHMKRNWMTYTKLLVHVFPVFFLMAEEEIDHYNDDFVLSQEFMW